MDAWLAQLRKIALNDQTPRLILIGATVVLFLVVIIDAFGARDRAVVSREAGGIARFTDDDSDVTVPSVYRVPRDFASESLREARLAQAEEETNGEGVDLPDEEEIAEAEDIAEAEAELEAEEEMAEAEAAEEEAAEAEAAEAEAAEAEAAEAEVAEAEATEEEAETAAEDSATEAAVAEDDLALLANADIANGESVWRQCRSCHVYDAERNQGGPHLVNIIGREVAIADGWRYSSALQDYDGVWTVEALLEWLENPDSYIPGNQMAFRGLRDEQDRIDVLGYLNENAQ
ncbi:MAG: hypothetical protein EA386_02295 [Rhodobacteraceae bacterium]|nr:MAG: hypothetical protein EA386_02295 [Paracoccaceae bacterium]